MENNTDRPKPRQHMNGKLTVVVMIFAIILIASVVLLFFVSKSIEARQGADTQIKLSGQGGFTCEYSEAQKLYPFADGVLKVTNDRAAYLTLSGNEVFSQVIAYSNPRCVVNNDYACVFDSDGYAFVALHKDKVMFAAPVTNKIKSCYISDSGYFAVITDGGDAYGEVILYNTSGGILSTWSSYNSGFPICVAFDDDSTMMAVSTVNTSGATAVPYVRLFSISRDKDAVDVSDLAIYTVPDSVVFANLMFINKTVYAFSSDGIYKVRDGDLVKLRVDFSSVNYVRKVGNNMFVVYSDSVDQLNKLAVINDSDNIVYRTDIGSDVNGITSVGNTCALSVDKRIFIMKNNGTITGDISVDEDVLRIGFIENDKLCAVSTSGVHTVN